MCAGGLCVLAKWLGLSLWSQNAWLPFPPSKPGVNHCSSPMQNGAENLYLFLRWVGRGGHGFTCVYAYGTPFPSISEIWRFLWQNPCGVSHSHAGMSLLLWLNWYPRTYRPYILGRNGHMAVARRILQDFQLFSGCRDIHDSKWGASVDWWMLSPKKAIEYQVYFSNWIQKTICLRTVPPFSCKQICSPIAHRLCKSGYCQVQDAEAKMHLQALVAACRRAL